jgi:hypothetical protein
VSSRQLPKTDPKLLIALAAVIVGAGAVVWALWPDRSAAKGPVGTPGQAFFSIDDGKNYFSDSVKKLPPFQKDGKEAFRAYVFKGADGKPFVSCLVRFTPDTKKQLEAIHAQNPEKPNTFMINHLEMDGMEVRAPGQTNWIKKSDPRSAELLNPRLPNGDQAEMVVP